MIITMLRRELGGSHSRIAGRDEAEIAAELADRRGPERILDLLLRTGPYGDAFGEDPDGLTLARWRRARTAWTLARSSRAFRARCAPRPAR